MVNEKFEEHLKRYAIDPSLKDLYKKIIAELYDKSVGQGESKILDIKKELTDYSCKIEKARELVISGGLDASDYRTVKADCERQISILEAKLIDASTKDPGINGLLSKALNNMARLPEIYKSANSQGKRLILSSMYPQKLIFDGVQHRTEGLNEAILLFEYVKAILDQKKERQVS